MNLAQLVKVIAAQRNQWETGAAYAQYLGVSPSYLSDVLKGTREPGRKFLEALGFERRVTYHKR